MEMDGKDVYKSCIATEWTQIMRFFFWNQLMQQRSEWQRILYMITILSSVNNSYSFLLLRQCTGEINISRFGGGVATCQYCPRKLPMLLKNQRHDKI